MIFNNYNKLTDFANRIIMAQKHNFSYVFLPHSKLILSIAKILKYKGFIKNIFLLNFKFRLIIIKLKYYSKTAGINYFKVIKSFNSKKYIKHSRIETYVKNPALSIFTTNIGVMSGEDCVKLGVGGKLICHVF